uniref:G protein-coupled receptor n=1 Tax=Steinernema glaseri TaxID=37863 RepID=A0A1I7Y0X3_9BILA
MERRVVIIEFSIAVILSMLALYFLMAIFRRKSLLKIWKQCPGLGLFLGSITLSTAFNGLTSIEWILIAVGTIENAPHNTVLIISSAHLNILVALFHYGTTIVLFAHRIHCLLYPLKPTQVFNHVVHMIFGLFCLAASVVLTYALISRIDLRFNPVPEDMVHRQVVLVEFYIIIILSSTSLMLQIPIFRMKSLQTTWTQSPALSIFIGTITFLALQNFTLACQWILFGWEVIENVPENTIFLVVVAHVGLVFRHFHNCVTVALFAQRVFFVIFPMKPIRKFNYFVLAIMGAVFAVDSIGATYITAINTQTKGKPVPEGCFSFNCMSVNGPSVRAWSSTFTVILTSMIMILGTLLLFLLRRFRKTKLPMLERQGNKFALYVFYIRFFCETVPYCTDIILSNTIHINLGWYIGPYGALGNTTDFTIKTVVYFLICRQNTKVDAVKVITVVLKKNDYLYTMYVCFIHLKLEMLLLLTTNELAIVTLPTMLSSFVTFEPYCQTC